VISILLRYKIIANLNYSHTQIYEAVFQAFGEWGVYIHELSAIKIRQCE
jgi:hypothetical protein